MSWSWVCGLKACGSGDLRRLGRLEAAELGSEEYGVCPQPACNNGNGPAVYGGPLLRSKIKQVSCDLVLPRSLVCWCLTPVSLAGAKAVVNDGIGRRWHGDAQGLPRTLL